MIANHILKKEILTDNDRLLHANYFDDKSQSRLGEGLYLLLEIFSTINLEDTIVYSLISTGFCFNGYKFPYIAFVVKK